MRVLQLICSTGFFGAERWVLALANNLEADQVQCHLLATSENPDLPIELIEQYPDEAGSSLRLEMSGRFDLAILKKIISVVRQLDIQVIHSHGYKSDLITLVVARLSGVRCISTPHGFGNLSGWKMKLYIGLGNFALRFFDAVVPLSPQLSAELRKSGISESKIRYIPNGVDLSEIDRRAVIDTGIVGNKEVQTIGFIGRLVPGKEILQLLQIFEALWAANNCLQLIIVGDGEQRQELEKFAATLSAGEHIHFLGFRADRLDILRQFDLFAMTSSSEGIPRSLMEAMSVGVPVVAYDIPGVDQLINHDDTGLMVQFGNQSQFVDCCSRVLANITFANSLSNNARRRIESNFSAASMAGQYYKLYRSLVAA